MTKNEPSTWPRPSPTARTTSWLGGRSVMRRIRAPRPRRSKPRSRRCLRNKLLEQALEVLVVRQHHALEQRFAAALHQDRGEVLDVDLFRVDCLGFVLDVHPAELGAREARRHGEEPGAV